MLADFPGETGAGRQTTQYRLGPDRDRKGGCIAGGRGKKEGEEKRRERCGFSDGGMVPKGIEVKRTRALICNSNEACLQ